MIGIGPKNYSHFPLWEFINEEQGEKIRLLPSDLIHFHKAIVLIVKHLFDSGHIKIWLPEFDEKYYDFSDGFSQELQKIIKIEANRYFVFTDVFAGFTEIEGIITNTIDFSTKRTPVKELEIGISENYVKFIPEQLITNLNRNYWYSRILWTRRVTAWIKDRDDTCYSELTVGDYDEHNAHKFGNELSVHFSGLLLQKNIENNIETYDDIGFLLIPLLETKEEGEEIKSPDYQSAINWVLKQYDMFRDHPPVSEGEKQNRENFIIYALQILKDPITAPNNIPLNITATELNQIWDEKLPPSGECNWKGGGNRPFAIGKRKYKPKLISKKK